MSSRLFPFSSTTTATFFLCQTLIFLFPFLHVSSALLHFRGDTFLDVPARFAVPIVGSGICGSLHVADPIDACSPILTANATAAALDTRFVLTERGTCSFQTKVRNAQDAGFQAIIVYDDREKENLISMIGDSEGIWIHAVFVSNMAGEILKKYARGEEGECCLGPSTDEAAGTALIISLISVVIVVSVLATFFFARNFRRLRHASRCRTQKMTRQEVEGLPCIKFKTFSQNKHTSDTCAICLEDYKDAEMLRVLPCQHEFHLHCVDSWLTKWGTFCPICKHDLSSKR